MKRLMPSAPKVVAALSALILGGFVFITPHANAAAVPLSSITSLYANPPLVSYYPLDGTTTDSFGSINGTPSGGVSFDTSTKEFTESASLDGSGKITYPSNTVSQSPFSFTGWIYSSSTDTNFRYIFSDLSGGYGTFFRFLLINFSSNGKIDFGVGENNIAAADDVETDTIPQNTWVFVAGTYDGTTSGQNIKLYINGVLNNTASFTQSATAASVQTYMGLPNDSYTKGFEGNFDDFAFFNRVLTPTQIKQIYDGTPSLSFMQQYISDGTNTIPVGATTTDNNIVFGATLNSNGTSTLQLELEVQPAGTEFINTPNVTSSASVSPGGYATSTLFKSPEEVSNGSYHWQARVKDANGVTSTWQLFGASTSTTDFIIKTVPLFTQIGSLYPSLASTSGSLGGWAWDLYDGSTTIDCNQMPSNATSTIGWCGCAITSVVMDLRYFGITTDTNNNPIDPRGLNTWLTNDPNVGYDIGGNLEWNQIPDYASSTSGSIIVDARYGSGFGTSSMRQYVDPVLTSSTPAPVILVEPDHFVVATGIAYNNGTSTYTIRDSAWYLTKYLNETTSTDTSTTINNYNNTATGAFALYDPLVIPRWGEYHVSLPDALMLVDSQGRRTGKDPITGTAYHEIPGTTYVEVGSPATNGAGELFTSDLPSGQYTLYVLGGQTNRYWLDASHYGQKHQTFSGAIQSGTMIAYGQSYDLSNIASSTLFFAGVSSSTASITSAPPKNL